MPLTFHISCLETIWNTDAYTDKILVLMDFIRTLYYNLNWYSLLNYFRSKSASHVMVHYFFILSRRWLCQWSFIISSMICYYGDDSLIGLLPSHIFLFFEEFILNCRQSVRKPKMHLYQQNRGSIFGGNRKSIIIYSYGIVCTVP